MLAALSLASGFSGLVYEVLWAKELGLLFGGTAAAQMTVLAVFLGGLALGNWALGRRADLVAPLRLYGRLELGVGALGIGALGVFRVALWAFPARYPIAIAAVLAPAFLMGGTIPALARAARPSGGEGVERAVAKIYFWNCLGAVFGALAAGYFLIARLGLDGAAVLAGSVNAACAFFALKKSEIRPAAPVAKKMGQSPASMPLVVVCELAFLAGLSSLVYETGWTRLLALVMGGSTYSFSAMLAGFIAGIAFGSLLLSSTRLGRAEPAALFGWAQLGVAAAVLACLPLYERLPYLFRQVNALMPRTDGGFALYEAAKFAFSFALMLPATALIGMTLPLMSRLSVAGEEIGGGVGRAFAFNTAGNMLGAVFAYWTLPLMGLEPMLRAATTVSALVGLAALGFSLPWPARRRWALAAVVVGALVGYRALVRPWDRAMLSLGDYRDPARPTARNFADYRELAREQLRLAFIEDDPESTVSVLRGVGPQSDVLSLKINGKTEASNGADMDTQVLIAELPLILRPQTRDVLVVGLGSGVTAGAALRHSSVRRVDVVELSPGVTRAARLFDRENDEALRNPRLHLTIADATSYLKRPAGPSYDLVLSEPSNPWMAGVANLFTSDFYADVKRRLRPGGAMLQWFHLYEMDDENLRLVLRTFAGSFKHVSVWNLHDADVLLLGTDDDAAPDWTASDRVALEPAVNEDLQRAGLQTVAALLSLQTASDAGARAMGGAGPLNADRRPILEYTAPVAYFKGAFSGLIDRNDDRVSPEERGGLLLASYRARRSLSSGEYMDIVTVKHSVQERAVVKYFVDDWAQRLPRDPAAALAQLIYLRETGDRPGALAAFRRLKRLDPRRRDLKELAASLSEGT